MNSTSRRQHRRFPGINGKRPDRAEARRSEALEREAALGYSTQQRDRAASVVLARRPASAV